MSPFTFADNEDQRLIVGRKETSLLLIELKTGKIKATLNSERAWDRGDEGDTNLDLDEPDGSKRPMSTPTEVYIKRTGVFYFHRCRLRISCSVDYHVSIRTQKPPHRNAASQPVQNLVFPSTDLTTKII